MLIEAPELRSLAQIRHAFFTREGGVSTGLYASLNGGIGSSDSPARVVENRRRMADRLGVAEGALVSLHQIHSPEAIVVERPWTRHDRPRADGMATREPGIALAISTADCGPVLFADGHAKVIGAAHAGWRGALGGVLEATLGAMESLGAQRRRIVAVLGPTISQAAYEVGRELVAAFREADRDNTRFFRPAHRDGHAMFDLPGYIGARLTKAGVQAFVDLAQCTYGDETRFFSYRRTTHRGEPDYGRLISAIALTP
jgi:YfiH family protein